MGDGPRFKRIGRHGYLTGEKNSSFYLNIFGTTESPRGLTCFCSVQCLSKKQNPSQARRGFPHAFAFSLQMLLTSPSERRHREDISWCYPALLSAARQPSGRSSLGMLGVRERSRYLGDFA